MKYQFIQELSHAEKAFNSTEIHALAKLWEEKKENMKDSDVTEKFITKMHLEWSIETGIIERLYTWDRGLTETLIDKGLNSELISREGNYNRQKTKNIIGIIKDQQEIIEGLFPFVKDKKKLTEHYIRELHQKITQNQDYTDALTAQGEIVQMPLLKGAYKKQPNNPKRTDGSVHEYCPVEHVDSEMQNLMKLYHQYEDEKRDPVLLSAWLHHRFTQIHPFQDGNGRIARTLASLVLIKANFFPLLVKNSDRTEYLDALETADKGNLKALFNLFIRIQRQSLLSALELNRNIENQEAKILQSTFEVIKHRDEEKQQDKNRKLQKIAQELHKMICSKLEEIKDEINDGFKNNEMYSANVQSAENHDKTNYYYSKEIIDMAKKHNYYANRRDYQSWVRLAIFTGSTFEILYSMHGYGHSHNGIMVVSPFCFEKADSENESDNIITHEVRSCHPEIFQFNYIEDIKDIQMRFDDWLQESILYALAEWNRSVQ